MSAAHPRPYHRNSSFSRPRVQRLTHDFLRRQRRHIERLSRMRLFGRAAKDVLIAVFQHVGWKGRETISMKAIAGLANVSESTVARSLDIGERLNLLRRHRQLKKGVRNNVVQACNFYELLPPPTDCHGDNDRVLTALSLAFLAWKRSRGAVGQTVKRLVKGMRAAGGPSSGNDEWGRANRDRQLALLRGS
jgi:DNA-binding MarR family transcriptional regulator